MVRPRVVSEVEDCWHCYHPTVQGAATGSVLKTCCWCGRTVGGQEGDARKGPHGPYAPGSVRVGAAG
jgi:hypothetical protein